MLVDICVMVATKREIAAFPPPPQELAAKRWLTTQALSWTGSGWVQVEVGIEQDLP